MTKKPKVLIVGGGRHYGKTLEAQKGLLEELESYRAIGTVSEFRELKEKATAKKPKKVEGYGIFDCPHCNGVLFASDKHKYCPCCGGLLDWSEGKE